MIPPDVRARSGPSLTASGSLSTLRFMAGRGTRDRVRTATRDALLEAAEHVFAEKGTDGARIEDIAARARVAVGTIYNYFGDSAELLKALINQNAETICSRGSISRWRTRGASAPPGRARSRPSSGSLSIACVIIIGSTQFSCNARTARSSSMDGVSSEFYARAEALVQRGVRLGLVRESRCRDPARGAGQHVPGSIAPFTDETRRVLDRRPQRPDAAFLLRAGQE